MTSKHSDQPGRDSLRLDAMLARTVEMDAVAMDILGAEAFELCSGGANVVACFNACEVALEEASR